MTWFKAHTTGRHRVDPEHPVATSSIICTVLYRGKLLFGANSNMTSEAKDKDWRALSPEQLALIEEARNLVKAKGRDALMPDPKGSYGIVCRACTKPNAPTVTFCTGCSFPASEWDIQRLPDNIFLELVRGVDIVRLQFSCCGRYFSLAG